MKGWYDLKVNLQTQPCPCRPDRARMRILGSAFVGSVSGPGQGMQDGGR